VLILRNHSGRWGLGKNGLNILSYIQASEGFQAVIILMLCPLKASKMDQMMQVDTSYTGPNPSNKIKSTVFMKNRLININKTCPKEKINAEFSFRGFDDLDVNEEPAALQSSQNKSDECDIPTLSQSPVRSQPIRNPPPLEKAPHQNETLMWSAMSEDELEREVGLIRNFLP